MLCGLPSSPGADPSTPAPHLTPFSISAAVQRSPLVVLLTSRPNISTNFPSCSSSCTRLLPSSATNTSLLPCPAPAMPRGYSNPPGSPLFLPGWHSSLARQISPPFLFTSQPKWL